MERFEVIVVGGGLAGLSAAYTLAGAGVEVLILERGDYSGAKNVTGGRIYTGPVSNMFPELWEDAPFERCIVKEGFTFLAGERALSLNFTDAFLGEIPRRSYSILRARFDRWFADKVESQGAIILPKTRVENVILEDGRVKGVVAGGDELRADVVIACDGVLSMIAERAGLRKGLHVKDFAVGVKEVVQLDEDTINERFHLQGLDGAAHLFIGDVTRGYFGGGFLYTNRDSLSLGIVLGLGVTEGVITGFDLPSLLEEFKRSPAVAPLIKGGTTVEYAAHLIPEAGFRGLGRLSGDGIIVAGDAAGFALNLGFTVRGMEYAMASGYLAAQAVLEAKKRGKFDADSLACYQRFLEESFIMKDFRNFRNSPRVLQNPRFFAYYPEKLTQIFRDVYAVSDGEKGKLYDLLRKQFTWRDLWKMVRDVRDFIRM